MIGSSIVASPEDGLDKLARHARGGLLLVAALQLGMAALLYVAGDREMNTLLTSVATGVLYGALAVWARRSPLLPTIIGLSLFVASLLLVLWLAPAMFLSLWGILVNLVTLTVLGNGVMSAREHARARRRMQEQRA